MNDERDEFTINETETDLFYWLSFNEIKNKVEEEIYNILKSEFPDIDTWNKKQIAEFKNENPELIGFIDENPKSFFIKKNEKLKALEKMQKLENDFESKKSKKNREQIITEAEKIGALKLTSYLKYRKEIIEQFEKYDLTQEKEEEKIRSHILKRGLEGTEYSPFPIEENNLWLLDDKFMSYNYVASEKAINTLLKGVGLSKTNSEDKFDIGIYSNNQNAKRVILIEMKKFSAGYKENGEGVNQLSKYAKVLSTNGINELYLYLIAKIDDEFSDNLINLYKFVRVFSQDGEVYQGALNNVNAYIQIVSPKALISDAKARNQTFLDFIINKQKIHNTNESQTQKTQAQTKTNAYFKR